MPYTIFKAPDHVKKQDFGRRERSTRARKQVETFTIERKTGKSRQKIKQSKWTLKERGVLLKKIQANGTTDLEKLLDPQLNKNAEQIKDYVQYWKKNVKMVEVLKADARHAKDTVWVPRKVDSAIEDWINLVGSCNAPTSDVMDCGHILPDVLSLIISEEKHPDPSDCEGVDYAAVYEYIKDVMNGDVPKEVSSETSDKLLEMMNELREYVILMDKDIREEKSLLECYTLRDVAVLNDGYVGKCTDPDILEASSFPKVNPLGISPALQTKNIIIQESTQNSDN